MMIRINRIGICITLIIGVMGCSQKHNGVSENPIEFEETHLTKSIIETVEDFDTFSVWGEFIDGSGRPPSPVFEDKLVFKKADKSWAYEGKRYWVDGDYDFYAIYPVSNAGSYQLAYDGKMPSEIQNYTLSEDSEDLLFDIQHKTFPFSEDENNYVSIQFQHLLSVISLNLKKDTNIEYDVLFKSVSIYHLPVQGNCSILNNKVDWSFEWKYTKERSSFELPSYSVTNELEIGTEYVQIIGPCLVFPQALTAESPLCLALRYSTSRGKEFLVRKELKGVELVAGKRYNFALKIGALGNIIFDQVEVNAWNSALAGSIIIPL